MHFELSLGTIKLALGLPAVLGWLALQNTLTLPDAPPWALQLGIVGAGLFFAGMFYVFKYFPWLQQCQLRKEARDAEREQHERTEQRRQWDALENMTITHAEAIKAIATAIKESKL